MKLLTTYEVDATILLFGYDSFGQRRLYLLDNGEERSWPAISGPFGKGPAPRGEYMVGKPTALDVVEENKAYTDPSGFAWFAPIKPTFKTERTGFGIHPDGNVPGTLGCIGVQEPSTRGLFDFLSAAPAPMVLYVV